MPPEQEGSIAAERNCTNKSIPVQSGTQEELDQRYCLEEKGKPKADSGRDLRKHCECCISN